MMEEDARTHTYTWYSDSTYIINYICIEYILTSNTLLPFMNLTWGVPIRNTHASADVFEVSS